MDVNEPIVEETTEKNPYGIEPESYAELEENHPKLYKNTSSGQSPKNPFIGGGGGGSSMFETIGTISAVDSEVDYGNSAGAEIALWAEVDKPCSLGEFKITASYTTSSGEVTDTVTIPKLPHYFDIDAQADYLVVLAPTTSYSQSLYVDESKTSGILSVAIPNIAEGEASLRVFVIGQPIGKVHFTLTACNMLAVSREFKDAMYLAQEM